MPDNQQMPEVSVVIPCYNAVKFVCDAVDSALEQTYKHLDVIVVDDGSLDGTYQLLKDKYRDNNRVLILTHYDHDNCGVAASRLLGVQKAKGKWIAFLDADDLFKPTKIEKQIEVLSQYRDAVLCHSAIDAVALIPCIEKFYREFITTFSIFDCVKCYNLQENPDFLDRNIICNSSVVADRQLLLDVMPRAPQLFQYEDFVLWILLSCKGLFVFVPEQLLSYRYHSESATAKAASSRLRILYSRMEMLMTLVTESSGLLCQAGILPMIGLRLRDVLDELASEYGVGHSAVHGASIALGSALDPSHINFDGKGLESAVVIKLEQKSNKLIRRLDVYERSLLVRIFRKLRILRFL